MTEQLDALAGSDHQTPGGLLHAGRRHLKVVTCLYLLIATLAIAVPAVLTQPRGESPHQISETTGR